MKLTSYGNHLGKNFVNTNNGNKVGTTHTVSEATYPDTHNSVTSRDGVRHHTSVESPHHQWEFSKFLRGGSMNY